MSNVPDSASPHPMDELLTHRTWVRALARTLVRDDASADDLAQDTWLRAARRPPSKTHSLRGWLATVMRNAARDGRRSETRRVEREHRVGPSDPSPAVSDVVARAEIQRRVIEAVFTLEEPGRRTVLMRYFDGLDVAEIAAREGVSDVAVRKRLSRAYTALRESLDGTYDGDRRAWCVLLLPLIESAPAPVLPTGTGAAVASGSGVLIAVGGAALVVAGVAAALMLQGEPDGGGEPPATIAVVEEDAPRAVKPQVDSAALDEEPITAESPIPPRWDGVEETAIVFGRCVMEDGEMPVIGARVSIGAQTCVTDRDGRFRIDGVDSRRRAVLTAVADGFATAQMTIAAPDPGARSELLDIRLAPPQSAAVLVLDPGGAPVDGATVSLYGHVWVNDPRPQMNFGPDDHLRPEPVAVAHTDEEGRAAFDSLAMGAHRAIASAPGFADSASELTSVPLPASLAGTLVLRLREAASLSGRVVDRETGEGVADVEVVVAPQELFGQSRALDTTWTRTADDGTFRFASVARGPCLVGARRAAGAVQGWTDVDLRTGSEATVFLSPERRVSGVVCDEATGEAVPFAWVEATIGGARTRERQQVRADARGRYAFAQIVEESTVWVAPVVGGPWSAAWEGTQLPYVRVETRDIDDFDVFLRRVGALAGTAALPGGVPAVDAEVLVVGSRNDVGTVRMGMIVARGRTDEDGAYRVSGIEPGIVHVMIRTETHTAHGWRRVTMRPEIDSAGEWPARVTIEPGATSRHDTVLGPGIDVSGVVVDDDGAPVRSARVVTSNRHTSSRYDRTTKSDENGCFVLRGIRHEDVALEVSAFTGEGIGRLSVGTPEPGDRVADVRIVLQPRESTSPVLSGVVTDERGLVVPGARLHVDRFPTSRDNDASWLRRRARHPRGTRVPIDADGTFATTPVDMRGVHEIALIASAPGHVPAVVFVRASDAATATDLRIELTLGATIAGRLVTHAGASVEGIPVTAVPTRPGSLAGGGHTPQTSTAADGTFTITGLEDTHHCVNFGHPDALLHQHTGVYPGAAPLLARLPADVDPTETALPEPPASTTSRTDPLTETAASGTVSRRLRGVVRDVSGVPVAGARIRLVRQTAHSRSSSTFGTRPGGTFTAQLRPDTPYVIEIDAGAAGWLRRDGVRLTTEPQEFTLETRTDAPCTGVARDPDGRLAGGLRVTAMRVREDGTTARLTVGDRFGGDTWDLRFTNSKRDGGFDLGYLPPGRWVVFAGQPGDDAIPADQHVFDSSAAEAAIELSTTRGWTLRAQLHDRTGEPLAATQLVVVPARALPAPFPEVTIRTFAERQGRIEVRGLPSGSVTVRESRGDPARSWTVDEQSREDDVRALE